MKKILALLLALTLLFALSACTGNEDTTPDGGEKPTGGVGEFEVVDAKYHRNMFVSKLEEYMASHKPNQKFHHDDGYDPELENGFKEVYIVEDFDEDDPLNLFLYGLNYAEGKNTRGWLVIDRFRYEHIDRETYSVIVRYTIHCAGLAEAIANAKNDAYRLGPFYGQEISTVKFYAKEAGKRKEVLPTDETFEKLLSGAYTDFYATPVLSADWDDGCRLDIKIVKTTEERYEYSCILRLQYET